MNNLKSILIAALTAGAVISASAAVNGVDSSAPMISQDFNSMWDSATETPLLTLPEGWRIDRNLQAPRNVGKWSDASLEVMYSGGESLASNAKNGTWNFGDSSNNSDRAIGGLTTTVANGTRGVSLITEITNNDSKRIDRLDLTYDIEKYRYGANAAGFAVQVYTSADGERWTKASDANYTLFEVDSETIGAPVVPISTTAVVNAPVEVNIEPGATLYIAWNISVASGTTPDKAPGLSLDNIVIKANFTDSSYVPVEPEHPDFVASGIYLRGEINGWAASDEWEFSNEEPGFYVIYDKELSGSFKVADANWSSSCNYGSNGGNILVDTPYQLSAGTDANISCGSYTFQCKRIILTIADGIATLMLESDDNEDGLTTLYMVGDFNDWNFMSTAGALKLDNSDNLFKGRVSMKAGENGLSNWRLYQRLGMGGAWGLTANATESILSGNLIKGETGNSAVTPATYDVTFSLSDGAFNFTEVEARPTSMALNPAEVILTPKNPEQVKVLSLNNSLIHYNDQDFVFNDIAKAMGANASWTKHTNLGKPLSYHWSEGDGLAEDGTPGAKMMVRSDAWSHIILQEQSSLPRTNPETFRANVKQWVEYIRQYCPNPNAVIILPVNWGYSSDWSNFSDYNSQFLKIYSDVAAEVGAVVCPVASAYTNVYTQEGTTGASTWFSDDRHPTPKATYLAACMEYSTILGVDPMEITFNHPQITAAESESMRKYASEACKGYSNAIDHLNGKVKFNATLLDDFGMEHTGEPVEYSVNGGGTVTPEGQFISDGSLGNFILTAKSAGFEKTAKINVVAHETEVEVFPAIIINKDNLTVSENFNSLGQVAGGEMPEGWRIDRQTIAPRTVGTYATASSSPDNIGGTSLPSNAKNGTWNFGATGSDDRAPGGITTGVDNGSRAINVYAHLLNDGKKNIENINLSYDIKKFRKGNNAAGFAVQLYYSYDGRNWTSAGNDFYTYFAPDSATEGYAEVPGETVNVSAVLPFNIGAGLDLYLAWDISVASGSAAQGAMALAIDNVEIAGNLPEVPQTRHHIYVENKTSWDALGLYAWGDSEIFGAWPGQAPIDELNQDGTTYQVFGLDTDGGNYNLIFNNWNNNKQLPDFPITGNRDYWFTIDDNGVKEMTSVNVVTTIEENNSEIFLTNGEIISNNDALIRIISLDGALYQCIVGGRGEVKMLPAGVYVATNGEKNLKFIVK